MTSVSSGNKTGAVYVCPLCGAEVAVIRGGAGTQRHFCCNVPMDLIERVNPVYKCPVCGSEVMAIDGGSTDSLELTCCNKEMFVVNA